MCLKLSRSMKASAKRRSGSRENRLVDMLPDENAVRQAGQVVEVDALRQGVLDLLALGDVERARDQQGAIENAHRLVRGEPGLLAGRSALSSTRCSLARLHESELPFAAARRPPPPAGNRPARRRSALGRRRQVGGGRRVGQDEAAVGVLHRQGDRQVVDDLLEQADVLLGVLLAPAQFVGQMR